MSNAIGGPGWLLQHSVRGAGVYSTIAEVGDLKGPSQALETDEVTNQSSPNFYKEFIATVLDGGDVTFPCNYIPGEGTQDSITGLLAWMQGRGLQDWKIIPPGAASAHTILFSAYVTKWDASLPTVKHAELAVTLKISGPVSTN